MDSWGLGEFLKKTNTNIWVLCIALMGWPTFVLFREWYIFLGAGAFSLYVVISGAIYLYKRHTAKRLEKKRLLNEKIHKDRIYQEGINSAKYFYERLSSDSQRFLDGVVRGGSKTYSNCYVLRSNPNMIGTTNPNILCIQEEMFRMDENDWIKVTETDPVQSQN